MEILTKILENSSNQKVLKFLGINSKDSKHNLIPYKDKPSYTHEGLEDFLNIKVPSESKYLLNNNGIIIKPLTGEIVAIQFGRTDSAFRHIDEDTGSLSQLKFNCLKSLKLKVYFKVSLNYFSNIHHTDIIDARALGPKWALSIYFAGTEEEKIQLHFKNSL